MRRHWWQIGSGESATPAAASLELERTYDTAPIGLACLSTDCRYLQVNQRLTEICEISVADHIGRSVRETVSQVADQVEQIVQAILQEGKPIIGVEVSGHRTDQNGVLISVIDSGRGLDPQNIDCIFDAFFTTKANGMGMGLSICRSIVEERHGRLWATPGVSHGSIFSIALPVCVIGAPLIAGEPRHEVSAARRATGLNLIVGEPHSAMMPWVRTRTLAGITRSQRVRYLIFQLARLHQPAYRVMRVRLERHTRSCPALDQPRPRQRSGRFARTHQLAG